MNFSTVGDKLDSVYTDHRWFAQELNGHQD